MLSLPSPSSRLLLPFYDRPTIDVARDLIGKVFLHQVEGYWLGGWIVETEAYLAKSDPASHSARGQTPGNQSMFDSPGTLYVYPIHAKHCLNAVTESSGIGAAVLIRALEPVWGIEQMQRSRGQTDLKRLTSGPAMICQALGIDRQDDGRDLISDRDLGVFASTGATERKVFATKRIGISKAKHRNLRFVDPDSAFLSRRP